ncbi:MAG: methionine synthase [Candidatus Omnitrophota bacterium]|nr:methionine synthase [Candidatus Omnitrophota bacterium]
MTIFRGMITGIGSLPYTNADDAVDLVLKYCPQAPFWPQLPKIGAREGMCAQFSEHLPALALQDNALVFDSRRQDDELEEFYKRLISEDVDYFSISPEYAAGLYAFYRRLEKKMPSGIEFIKCHITGPFTFAAGLSDDSGKSLVYDTVFMQALVKGLAMKARWQIDFFRKFGREMIVFIDEPYLAGFGSAYTAINRQDIIQDLTELTSIIKPNGAMVGVHCCGNTDWSIFTDTPGIDIINFDAFDFLDKILLYADNLKAFFGRGGALCWGIAPTQEFNKSLKAQVLLDKIDQGVAALEKKGLERAVILKNMLLSPACGLGTLTPDKAEGIFALLAEVSEQLRSR